MDHRLLLSRQGLCRTLSFWSESRTRGQGKGAGHARRDGTPEEKRERARLV